MTKRILIFSTTYYPLAAGAEIAMKEITDRLPGWQFDLICARIQPGLADTEKIGNVTVHRVGFGTPFDKYLLPILGVKKATEIAKEEEVGAIWSLLASYGGFAALAYTWVRPKTKMLLTLQEGDPLEHYAKRVGWLAFLHRKIFQRANAVTAISSFLAQWAKAMGFKGYPEVIPNGVDIERFSQKSESPSSPSSRTSQDVVIVTTSRLSLKNGVDDLIRSLAYLPENHKLVIVGDGEDRTKLEALVREKNLSSRVTFLGEKSHDEIPAILHASDIFCRPSLSEGLGNSFLEAMTAGLPIIGTPVGGIPDFLKDGETGVFCQVRNPESIAKAVTRMLGEPGLREQLIARGSSLVAERYGWEGIVRKVENLLEELASRA